MQYYQPNYYYRGEESRSLLLPLLVGAAVGFPFGYIASNTNKNNQQAYYPVIPNQVPIYQVPYQMPPIKYLQPYPYLPY